MSKPKAVGGECVRLQDGESFTIVAIVVDGACPAIEFLKGLDSRPRAKVRLPARETGSGR